MRSPGLAAGSLCRRLAAIAELVPPGRTLADVGTDHAFLPVALVLRGVVPRALACDRAADPLVQARATIERHGLADRITVRRGEGLAALEAGEASTLVIAGMGFETMLAILAADLGRTRGFERVVLQPNFGQEDVRRWLVAHGLDIVDERLVLDRGRFYTAIAAEPTSRTDAPAWSRAAWALGPVVLRRGGDVLDRFLAAQLAFCDRQRPDRPDIAARRAVVAEALAEARAHGHPGPA